MKRDLLYLVLALFSGYMHTQDALNQLNQQHYTPYFYQPCTFKAEDAPPTVSFKYGLCTTESHNGDRTHHQTPIYSPQIALAQICHAWSEPQFADTIEHCIEYYVSCGYSRDDAHEHILKQHALYLFPSFIRNIKKLSGYRPYIKNLHQQLLDKQGRGYRARKMFGFVNRGYIKLRAVTEQLYNEIIAQEKTEAAQHAAAQKRKAQQDLCKKQATLRIKHDNVRTTFDAQYHELMQESREWHELLEMYHEKLGYTTRIERRIQALNLINKEQIKYTEQSYKLSASATQLIQKIGTDAAVYTTHYGNQLQQVIHQECIDGIEHCATLQQPSAAMYPYQQGIAHCFDAAREFNEIGQTNKATAIADFCWTLLDCGLAIAEGAVDGVVGAVKDIAEHPVQAAICAVAGPYVLAYQLSKVLYNVADIGITALEDTNRAAQKWDEYIAPITQIIDAIAHQQIIVRDALKGATLLAVQWKVQGKILKGLGNICTTAKNRALEFAQKYPLTTSQNYMVAPEGILLKSSHNAQSHGSHLKCERSSKLFIANHEEIAALTGQAQKVIQPPQETLQTLGCASLNTPEKFLTHIFAAELKEKRFASGEIEKTLSGFHYFKPEHLEEMGIQLINAKTCGKTGIIIADVLCDGHLEPSKTFFPTAWGRNKVIEKIGEAVQRPIDLPVLSGTRARFLGQTSEGIIVRAVIDIQSGSYITAYPDAHANGLI